MTNPKDRRKDAGKLPRKLSVKKEIIRDLDVGKGKARELGDDQLDVVNGGTGPGLTAVCVRGTVKTLPTPTGGPQTMCRGAGSPRVLLPRIEI